MNKETDSINSVLSSYKDSSFVGNPVQGYISNLRLLNFYSYIIEVGKVLIYGRWMN